MSYIGLIGAKRLNDCDSSLCLIKAQKEAINMLRNCNDMYSIKLETGWEIGADGKWRYEIEDPFITTTEIEDHLKRHFGERINIKYFMKNTSLLIAYPEFKELKLFSMYSSTMNCAGYFSPTDFSIMLSMGTANSPFDFQTDGILLHEVQHLIQEVECFAKGGDGKDPMYHYLAGEVEARNICYRHFLTKEERIKKLRTDTQDVPDDMQVIRF